ncbi:hypothetical protein PGT21_011889 [Puccinia graminis f. sp. tritici]|uniref:Uncharacterized protein n=1 Tax=Puccinia graminis f. sp. tritici TaxID=56615 RepID=A0A5B0PXD3_PUCGR|nr:hypothetical protein PGT21_011889 [Puccinia graminis f. sp. tritici]
MRSSQSGPTDEDARPPAWGEGLHLFSSDGDGCWASALQQQTGHHFEIGNAHHSRVRANTNPWRGLSFWHATSEAPLIPQLGDLIVAAESL